MNIMDRVLESQEKLTMAVGESSFELLMACYALANNKIANARKSGEKVLFGAFHVSKRRGQGGPTFIVGSTLDIRRMNGIIGGAKKDERFSDWLDSINAITYSIKVRLLDETIDGTEDLTDFNHITVAEAEELLKSWHNEELETKSKSKTKSSTKSKAKAKTKVKEPVLPEL